MRTFLTGFTGLLILGCGGLIGYGQVVATQPVQSGQPFSLTYTPTTSEPHQLWFEIDLDSQGPYDVQGTVTTDQGGSWSVHIRPDGPPVGGMRKTYMWSETNLNGKSSAAGSIHGVELPGASGPVTISGTLTNGSGTNGSVALVVTD